DLHHHPHSRSLLSDLCVGRRVLSHGRVPGKRTELGAPPTADLRAPSNVERDVFYSQRLPAGRAGCAFSGLAGFCARASSSPHSSPPSSPPIVHALFQVLLVCLKPRSARRFSMSGM